IARWASRACRRGCATGGGCRHRIASEVWRTIMAVTAMLGRRAMLGGAALLALTAPAILTRSARAAGTGFDGARHLLSRTGFGPTPSEIAQFEPFTHEAAIDVRLRTARPDAATPPPSWIGITPPEARQAQQAFQRQRKA